MKNVNKLVELKAQKTVLMNLVDNLNIQVNELNQKIQLVRAEKWKIEDSAILENPCAYDEILRDYNKLRGQRKATNTTICDIEDMIASIEREMIDVMKNVVNEMK